MGKYFCDYCQVFLTHDSAAVRKQHNDGNKHKQNVCEYYREFINESLQRQIDAVVADFERRVALGLVVPTYGLAEAPVQVIEGGATGGVGMGVNPMAMDMHGAGMQGIAGGSPGGGVHLGANYYSHQMVMAMPSFPVGGDLAAHNAEQELKQQQQQQQQQRQHPPPPPPSQEGDTMASLPVTAGQSFINTHAYPPNSAGLLHPQMQFQQAQPYGGMNYIQNQYNQGMAPPPPPRE